MKGTPAQIAAYVGKSERTIHRWLASGKLPYTKLPGGLIEVDDALLFGPENEQESTILATLKRIEDKLDALSARVSQPSAHADIMSEPVSYEQKAKPVRVLHETAPVQSELPEGYVPVEAFCREHDYTITTVRKWIDKGDIPAHRGRWKHGRTYVQLALDEEGRQAVQRRYGR